MQMFSVEIVFSGNIRRQIDINYEARATENT